MKIVYLASLLAPALLTGCTRPAPPGGSIGTGHVSAETSVAYIAYPDRTFAVWSDISLAHGSHGTASLRSGGEESVSVTAGDGREVTLQVWTTNGKASRVAVNGVEYRVEDGTSFLARTRGDATEVVQLRRTLPGLPDPVETRRPLPRDAWWRLAQEQPEVRAFVAGVPGK
jgi:hypothetical protein